jgi:aryl-alcohol dehydrogenase-like predicted oxidoreductase
VIAGATSAEQVHANTAGVQAWPMSDDDLAEVDLVLGEAGRR